MIYLYIVIALLFLWILGFIVFWPYFKVQTINIIRQDNLSNINIAYKSLENTRGQHIMFLDKAWITKNIKSYQENIESVSISRQLPNKLNIDIHSHEPIFNAKVNQKNYIITQNGSFIPEKENPELKELKIISNKTNTSIPDYRKTIEQIYINQILEVYDQLTINIIRLQIQDITYFPIERELMINIEGNTTLIFDLSKPILAQVKRLAIFDTENIKVDTPSILYIDLRINDRVFYCTTETEYQCIINLKNIYPEAPKEET